MSVHHIIIRAIGLYLSKELNSSFDSINTIDKRSLIGIIEKFF